MRLLSEAHSLDSVWILRRDRVGLNQLHPALGATVNGGTHESLGPLGTRMWLTSGEANASLPCLTSPSALRSREGWREEGDSGGLK